MCCHILSQFPAKVLNNRSTKTLSSIVKDFPDFFSALNFLKIFFDPCTIPQKISVFNGKVYLLNTFARLIGYSLPNRQIIFTLHDLKLKAANTSGTVVKWLSLLHNFTTQVLRGLKS